MVGAYPLDADDVGRVAGLSVSRVLNLVQDSEYQPGEREAVAAAYGAAGITERRMDLVDFGHLPPDRLEEAVSIVLGWMETGAVCYVHCRAGWQRSAAVAAGVVAITYGLGIDDSLSYMKAVKPTADPLPHQREDLHAWWATRPRADGAA